MKFRKKPVVIDAEQWTGNNIEDMLTFILNGREDFDFLPNPDGHVNGGIGYIPPMGVLVIPTLEGNHDAKPGDWIIRGVKGEYYPCKPEIFEMTYEPVEEWEA